MQVKPSITFTNVHVSEIGLRSLSMALGGITLGRGLTIDDLRRNGIYPSLITTAYKYLGL